MKCTSPIDVINLEFKSIRNYRLLSVIQGTFLFLLTETEKLAVAY